MRRKGAAQAAAARRAAGHGRLLLAGAAGRVVGVENGIDESLDLAMWERADGTDGTTGTSRRV